MNIEKKISKYRIHFYIDEVNQVYSYGKEIYIKKDGVEYTFDISNTFEKFAKKSKLLSRIFRLNRLNIVKISDSEYLVISKGKLFKIKNNSIVFKFKFPFTNYVHNNTITVHNNLIVVGEYGNSKGNFDVGVFLSSDKGESWKKINLFEKGFVKEILSIYYDKFSANYWVFTGDKLSESKILLYSQNWDLIECIGEYDFQYRAISAFFFKKYILWFMNNPFGESFVIRYDRFTKKIKKCQKLPGPAWYSIKIGNKYFLSIASENSIQNNDVYLMSSNDAENWTIEQVFKKDFFPKSLFLFGLINFAQTEKNNDKLVCFFEAVKELDSSSLIFKI